MRDYEEKDCCSGTEADNEEKEEDGDYHREYDQEDKDRENEFFYHNAEEGPTDMEINPNFSSQLKTERPCSRADSEMENAEYWKKQRKNLTWI